MKSFFVVRYLILDTGYRLSLYSNLKIKINYEIKMIKILINEKILVLICL
jgi:hypothetical protein